MRRKQKRLLQIVLIIVVAFLFLPNVGLWSIYLDRMFDSSAEAADGPGSSYIQVTKHLLSTFLF